MERWQNKIAVVTGASSGIGVAIVKDLIKNGLQVIGLARRVERVENIKTELPKNLQTKLTALKCDVSNLKSVNETFDKIVAQFGGIDILVNNAGCVKLRQFPLWMFMLLNKYILQTNVLGVVYCTQLISSMGGRTPDFNIYPASKFAVTAITEVYRQEFNGLGTKIKVNSISPGAVDTEILDQDEKSVLQATILKAEDIASSVVYAFSTPFHIQIHEMVIKPIGELF